MKSFEGKFKEQKSAKDSWQAVEDEGRQLTKVKGYSILQNVHFADCSKNLYQFLFIHV